jgi:hypothetical protein
MESRVGPAPSREKNRLGRAAPIPATKQPIRFPHDGKLGTAEAAPLEAHPEQLKFLD